ncbi:hypothetical protein KSD_39850 [Ktedonobacter sp. SOSP1-85]|uniref:DHH family phosphoesterase n=1 Tax=Ktedonobacter sp. SOSP1-85 TaxID=2778367 RepID=UPI0019164A09|nr:DHH family phosphoesterase [Ktedonobacter sp. SOSP1-85]GHO76214.1 hypothetical protein KSD_39850 [Ktedonobacter sp. SOSP1-85]
MAQQSIYVIGHKNSDMDSVASAYAYARLLQLQGQENVIPARHGQLKPEIRYALERFQVTPPRPWNISTCKYRILCARTS